MKHLWPRLPYNSGHVSEGLVASVDTGSKSAFGGGVGGGGRGRCTQVGRSIQASKKKIFFFSFLFSACSFFLFFSFFFLLFSFFFFLSFFFFSFFSFFLSSSSPC